MKTIKVKGSAKIEKNIVAYRAKIIMTKDQSEIGGEAIETVDDLKSQYYHALLEHDVDVANFEENEFEYYSQNYNNLGTMLVYTCKTFKGMQKLLNVKLPSIYSTAIEVKVSDVEQYQSLLEKAINDAKLRAKQVAKTIGKKVTSISSVQELNNLSTFWTYYSPYEEFFDVDVTFEIE